MSFVYCDFNSDGGDDYDDIGDYMVILVMMLLIIIISKTYGFFQMKGTYYNNHLSLLKFYEIAIVLFQFPHS